MTSSSPLRIVFAGTPDFAAHYLDFVLNNTSDQVVAVYTQPDRPAGRGKKLQPSPVKLLAEQHDLAIFQPPNLKDPAVQEELRALAPDLILVVAYGLILPKEVLNIPAQGCINVHASLLPRWRGAAPIQRAIEAGDKTTGITIMQMDTGLDTGDMLATAECEISAIDTGGSLHDKLCRTGEPALLQALEQISTNKQHAIPQNDALSNYAPKISKQEANIDWATSASTIERKIRAFHPFPVAYTQTAKGAVRIHKAYALSDDQKNAPPGTILCATDDGIDVATGAGAIRIKQLQLPGKRSLSAAEVLRGNRPLFAPGNQISAQPLQPAPLS